MFPKNTAPLYGGCVLYTSPPAVQAAATCLILYIQYMQCEPLRRYSPIIQYSYLVWGRAGGRRASLLLPLPPLPCCTCYCTSVQFTNFVRELLVNITTGKVWMEYTIGQVAGEPTECTECWPCLLFDILLNKYFPAGWPNGR